MARNPICQALTALAIPGVMVLSTLVAPVPAFGQVGPAPTLSASTFQGLAFRGIGPGIMSGRIADIAIDPTDRWTWYVGAGSGGVWKTTDAGTTWTPVFDGQGSYSIGTISIDPNDHEVVWVGTGENVSGRHVGFGDGVYRSRDGGEELGEHGTRAPPSTSDRILVDPRDSNVVLVAAEGPLWSSGGERGVYKHDGRRLVLDPGARGQRRDGRHRHRARSVRSGRPLRGNLPEAQKGLGPSGGRA